MNTLRIAIRAEGQMVNAYVAMTDEEVLIASFHRALSEDCPDLLTRFRELVQHAGAALIEQIGGTKVRTVSQFDMRGDEKAGHA